MTHTHRHTKKTSQSEIPKHHKWEPSVQMEYVWWGKTQHAEHWHHLVAGNWKTDVLWGFQFSSFARVHNNNQWLSCYTKRGRRLQLCCTNIPDVHGVITHTHSLKIQTEKVCPLTSQKGKKREKSQAQTCGGKTITYTTLRKCNFLAYPLSTNTSQLCMYIAVLL